MKKPVSSSSLRAKVGYLGWALLEHSPDLAMLPLDQGNKIILHPFIEDLKENWLFGNFFFLVNSFAIVLLY